MAQLSPKQINFCIEYLIDFNGAAAAYRAGYSKKSAREQAAVLLTKPNIQNYIAELTQKKHSPRIADQKEILELLTAIARGDMEEETVAVESIGDYQSRARIIPKKVIPKDRVKALELLGKANALFVDKVELEQQPISIVINCQYE